MRNAKSANSGFGNHCVCDFFYSGHAVLSPCFDQDHGNRRKKHFSALYTMPFETVFECVSGLCVYTVLPGIIFMFSFWHVKPLPPMFKNVQKLCLLMRRTTFLTLHHFSYPWLIPHYSLETRAEASASWLDETPLCCILESTRISRYVLKIPLFCYQKQTDLKFSCP